MTVDRRTIPSRFFHPSSWDHQTLAMRLSLEAGLFEECELRRMAEEASRRLLVREPDADAVRNEALEEAAKVCERRALFPLNKGESAFEAMAKAIRKKRTDWP